MGGMEGGNKGDRGQMSVVQVQLNSKEIQFLGNKSVRVIHPFRKGGAEQLPLCPRSSFSAGTHLKTGQDDITQRVSPPTCTFVSFYACSLSAQSCLSILPSSSSQHTQAVCVCLILFISFMLPGVQRTHGV